MADISYQQARRLGLKEVKARSARNEYPYLYALEDHLEHLNSLNEQMLGSFRIDLDQVAGTYTASRRDAFPPPSIPCWRRTASLPPSGRPWPTRI